MFRQVSTAALLLLTALGSLALTTAGEPKVTGDKGKGPPKELTVDLGDGIKLDLILIPAGEFKMGSPSLDHAFQDSEKPQHQVRITKPFYLGKYEVTQEQWQIVMGENRSYYKGPKKPVDNASWEDCEKFLDKLNAKFGARRGKFLLPTEAQWEYACRAGSTTRYCFGDEESGLREYAWYRGGPPHPVGEKKPNAWGLYDMHGNVYEWCADWYDPNYYARSPTDDPAGPAERVSSSRVCRGGSAACPPSHCESAYRGHDGPGDRDSYGLRVSLVPAEPIAEPLLPKSGTQDKGSGNAPPLAVAPFTATTAGEHQEAWAKYIGQPRETTNSIGMKLTLIPAGEFKMGSRESARDKAAFFNKKFGSDEMKAETFENEHPQHCVRITKPFYLGTCHVTLGQFRQFVADTGYKTDAEKEDNGEKTDSDDGRGWNKKGAFGWNRRTKLFEFSEEYSWRNVGFEQTDEHPVVNVSWNDAFAFCAWLIRKEAKAYRFPSEAEWEYACRAGTTTRYYSGDDPEMLAKFANVADAAFKAKFADHEWTIKASDGYAFTSPVGRFQPNAFGLYDMHGNAWQWCADWRNEKYYAGSGTDNPTGPSTGKYRVVRGGSWYSGPPDFACSASRDSGVPNSRFHYTGFRVARTP